MTEPFRPSNGTQADIFFADFCEQCKSNVGCRIRSAAMSHTEDDPNYPKEWIAYANGSATCTAFETITESEVTR